MSVSKRTAQAWNTCITWDHRDTDYIQERQFPYLASNKHREMKEYSRCISRSSVAAIKHYSQRHALEGRMAPQGSGGSKIPSWWVSGMAASLRHSGRSRKLEDYIFNSKQEAEREPEVGSFKLPKLPPPVMDSH